MAQNNNSILKEDLIYPIYLDSDSIIDLIAIIEDGFSSVSTVISETNQNTEARVNGLLTSSSNILSHLLNITFTAGGNLEKKNQNKKSQEYQKAHTLTSLFIKLKKFFREKKLINNGLSLKELKPGDFIEIEGVLNLNSNYEAIEKIEQSIQFMRTLELTSPPTSNKNNKNKNQNTKSQSSEIKQLETFLKELQNANSTDLLIVSHGVTYIINTNSKYLDLEKFQNYSRGRFKVFGKISQVINSNSEAISLMGNNIFKVFSNTKIEEFFKNINKNINEKVNLENLNFPEFKFEIKGPAVKIIPYAIYL